MSEKSFAITSIAAAVICGTFFYPPPPVDASAVSVPAAVSDTVPAQKPMLAQEIALLDVADQGMAKGDTLKLSATTPDAQSVDERLAAAAK